MVSTEVDIGEPDWRVCQRRGEPEKDSINMIALLRRFELQRNVKGSLTPRHDPDLTKLRGIERQEKKKREKAERKRRALVESSDSEEESGSSESSDSGP